MRSRSELGMGVVPPAQDCWLHPGVEVRRSPVAGVGLFAKTAVPAGTVVSRLGGRLVSSAELSRLLESADQDPERRYVNTITVDEGLHLVLPQWSLNGYGNHSCDPNLWWVDAYTLVARRDIAPGEEVTNDYATSTMSAEFAMECRCGSSLCRRWITGDDWRLPHLERQYGEHWVPAVLARIRSLTS